MLPRKILKVETKICAVWGILEANLKKSSTLKFIMNISFLTSICVRRSIILIFIGEKVCLLIFFQRKNFFSMIFDFHFRENPRFRDETGKNQNNMKQTWNKRTIKQNADLLVRTRSSRDTRNRKPDPTHWSFGCSHSHTSPIRESCQTQTSFYFLFQPSPELPFVFHGCVDFRHKCFLAFCKYDTKGWDSRPGGGQPFGSSLSKRLSFASSRNIVDTHTKWPPIRLQSLNGWLASDDWVTSLRCRLG